MSLPDNPHEPTPCACEASKPKWVPSRRDFLLVFGLGLNAVAGALISVPILGYVLSSFAKKYNLKEIDLGPISNFPRGKTRLASYKNPYSRPWDGEMDEIPCWVRNIDDQKFQIFAINCTHLGCPVRWFEESKFFMCPCHGGAYYEDGSHAAGPPPRGLYEYEYAVKNGRLTILGGILPTLATKNMDGEKA